MQKRNLIHKLNTKILCVLILFVLIYITAGFVQQTLNISYGATYTYTKIQTIYHQILNKNTQDM